MSVKMHNNWVFNIFILFVKIDKIKFLLYHCCVSLVEVALRPFFLRKATFKNCQVKSLCQFIISKH